MQNENFKILSIDGGGIRGVFPAHILQCIESRLGIDPTRHFNMLAGTSIGAIIAAALACKIKPEVIVAMYKDKGERIFKKKCSWLPSFAKPGFHSLYDSAGFAELLKEIFKDTKLGDISTPLILPATDIGHGGVHVFKSNYSSSFTRDNHVLVRDAVLASCSAPTYFDPARVNEYALADGGLWANNPSLTAVIDAQRRLSIERKGIKILSLGTGHSRTYYSVKIAHKRWGLLNGWRSREFIDFLMSLQGQSIHNYLELSLSKDQLLRVNFESDCPLPLDDCSAIDDLISRADRTFTHESEKIKTFLTT